MLYFWVLVCELDCTYSSLFFRQTACIPNHIKSWLGSKNILYRITCPLTYWAFIFIIVYCCLEEPPPLSFFRFSTTAFVFFVFLHSFPFYSFFIFSLCLLVILFSHRSLSLSLVSLLPLLLSSISPSRSFPLGWCSALCCSPGGNVFLITACVSSYLQFFYQWPPHMPERRGGGTADAISRWRFHHWVQGPRVWSEEGQTGRVGHGNMQCELCIMWASLSLKDLPFEFFSTWKRKWWTENAEMFVSLGLFLKKLTFLLASDIFVLLLLCSHAG